MTLNEATRRSIEKSTGLSYAFLIENDAETIDRAIEKKIKKKLTYNLKKDTRLLGRGSVFVALRRFLFPDNLEKELDRINK
jgi:F0F1-type ATP synthase delta subunit